MEYGSRADLLSFVFPGRPAQSSGRPIFLFYHETAPLAKGRDGFSRGLQRAKIGEGPGCLLGGRAFLCQPHVDRTSSQPCSERFFHFKISRYDSAPACQVCPTSPAAEPQKGGHTAPCRGPHFFTAACASAQLVAGKSNALIRPNPAQPRNRGAAQLWGVALATLSNRRLWRTPFYDR